MSADNEAPVVMLLGPTASGKSALSMAIAERFPIEIISVDSALVYRGMDIGTAKPDAAERARVAHHLIDIVDPTDAYSAARFAQEARRLCAEIRARGRLPLLVGGTMLYARAFADGLSELPPADPGLRAQLDAQAAQLGWPALHARLARLDPPTAARLEPGDAQRIQRALEIIELSGQPMSGLLARARPKQNLPAVCRISLEPSDRAVLHRRIAERFQAMIRAGLLSELLALRTRFTLHPDLPSMRAVGYRQAWRLLDTLAPHTVLPGTPDDPRLRELLDTGIAATRQLAKRQLTWLRSMPDCTRIDCLADDALDQALRALPPDWRRAG